MLKLKQRENMKNQLLTSIAGIVLLLNCEKPASASPVLDSVGVGPQAPASINPGSNATYSVTVNRTGTGNIDIYLSCSNLPAGATANFSPTMVHFTGSDANSATSTLTIATTGSTPTGVYGFTVTARDGGSPNIRTNTGTLTIGTDGKTSLAPQSITSVQMLPDHTFQIALSAGAGKSYLLQATTSLNPPSWTAISTNTADAAGLCVFIDSTAANYSSRFYRTSSVN
jgi:hypothetical protein